MSVLKLVMDEQEEHIHHLVQSATALPARKGQKPRKEPSEEEQPNKKEKRKRKHIIPDEPLDPVNKYVVNLRESLQLADAAERRGAQEKKLRRVLGDAMAAIGRSRWGDGRKGMGKPAVWKIQLNEGDEESEEEPPQPGLSFDTSRARVGTFVQLYRRTTEHLPIDDDGESILAEDDDEPLDESFPSTSRIDSHYPQTFSPLFRQTADSAPPLTSKEKDDLDVIYSDDDDDMLDCEDGEGESPPSLYTPTSSANNSQLPDWIRLQDDEDLLMDTDDEEGGFTQMASCKVSGLIDHTFPDLMDVEDA